MDAIIYHVKMTQLRKHIIAKVPVDMLYIMLLFCAVGPMHFCLVILLRLLANFALLRISYVVLGYV